jgi:multidrug efflux pump subunit AcrA (membrane-fusion protein)
MKKSTIGFFVVVLLLLLGILAVGLQMVLKKDKGSKKTGEATVPVVVMKVSNGVIEDVINLTGYIDPNETVNVISKIFGKFVRQVVEKGAYVGKEQIIAYVMREDVGVQFEPFPVKSPIAGVVAKFNFDPGTTVSPSFPIAVVVNIDRVLIKTSVVEKDYAKVKMGQLGRIYTDAYPDRFFEGHVSKISPTLDNSSHTAEIEIEIPNPGHLLKPGMFVKVELVVGKHEGVPVIPKTVVSKRLGKDMIFVVNTGTGMVEMREAQLGFYDLNNYEIVGGVKTGELVVAQDQAILQDGVKVSITKNINDEKAQTPSPEKQPAPEPKPGEPAKQSEK